MLRLVAYCKDKGFVFPGSEIYGGLANSWDYGPLGVELKNNIKRLWWKTYIQDNENAYGLDCAILMNPEVWKASGHLTSFSDPLMDCKECKARFRADTLIEDFSKGSVCADGMTNEQMEQWIQQHNVACPLCKKHNFTNIRQFNLMFKTNRGVVENDASAVFLRPETAQGQYVNFFNVQRSQRAKVPFGIGQIGKSFRNEITPGNFTFRTIEFEQMEFQWFCRPGEDEKFYQYFKQKAHDFSCELGLKNEELKYHNHEKLAFYAKSACDVYFQFPFGLSELAGIHNRTNYDLKKHQECSGKQMEYMDPITNEKFVPYIVETSFGADRSALAVLSSALKVEKLEDGSEREILDISLKLAPIKAAIFPLIKKNHATKAEQVYAEFRKHLRCVYDDTASIGKRYRRQDSIGTPFCVTVDDETLKNGNVTLRNRNTMEQTTMDIASAISYVISQTQI
ncbi:MAG: glycine--tRNA ligase [Clostridia bacterium]